MKGADCRRTTDRLAAYADRELPAEQRAEVEEHLDACRGCRADALAEEGGRTMVRERAESLRSAPLPPGLRSRCEALAREHTKPASARTWRVVPVSMTAVLTLFIATVVFSLATRQSDTLLAAQLTADHSKCFGLFAAPDAPVADARHLEEMLLSDYGWKVRVPPSSPEDGIQLIGARRCLYADGRMPHVMYRVNGQDMSLFMLDGVSRNDAEVSALGHRSRIWSRGSTTYVLVGPSVADLSTAVRYIMREAH